MKVFYPKSKDNVSYNIYKSGVVADLTVSKWGAMAKLKPEDLGLGSIPELIKLGHKELMKPEYLEKIRSAGSRFEDYLNHHSYVFPFGSARFVTYEVLEDVLSKAKEAEKEFNEAVEEFLNDYDTRRAEMLTEYREVFKKILEEKEGDEPFAKQLIMMDVENLVSKLSMKYPSRADLESRFNFDFTTFEVGLPGFNQLDNKEAIEKVHLNIEYKAKASKKIDSFLDQVIETLKGRVLEITGHMKKRLDAGNLNQLQIKSFVKFAEDFKKQDFIGMELDQILNSFKDKLAGADKEKLSDEQFKANLAADLNEIEDKVVNQDVSKVLGKYFRRIEMAEEE